MSLSGFDSDYFLSLGVAVSAFRLAKSKDVVKVNERQNASLQWSYEVDAGENYSILWGTSQDGVNVQHKLYTRQKGQTAQRSAQMPTKFVDRVKIIKQATLFIQRVNLSDEGYYMCQISGEFLTNREPIRLEVIEGECKIVILVFFAFGAKPSAIRFSYKAIYVCNDQGRGPNCTLPCLEIPQPGTVFKKLDTRQSEILTNFLGIACLRGPAPKKRPMISGFGRFLSPK